MYYKIVLFLQLLGLLLSGMLMLCFAAIAGVRQEPPHVGMLVMIMTFAFSILMITFNPVFMDWLEKRRLDIKSQERRRRSYDLI